MTPVANPTTSGSSSGLVSFLKHTSIFVIILGIVVILLVCALLVWGLLLAFRNRRLLPTPDNIKRIQKSQLHILEKQWSTITQGKQGLSSSINTIPEDQRLLINATVLSTRLTGYLGPFNSGAFNEDDATRISLNSGARCLILEIDREVNSYEPSLIYRDGWGIKQSLNIGSVSKVAKSIAGRAFTGSTEGAPPNVANDPLFVVLYFVSTPDPAKTPQEYVRFMAKVAEQIEPLNDLIIAQTPQGDFRRQALESQLFFMNYRIFSGKIILMTNADTTPFRRLKALGLDGELGSKQDLDLMVHVRLYSRESPSGLGITSSPTNNVKPAAIITTPNYWLNTPPDRLADAQSQTKAAWSIVMPPVSTDSSSLTKDDITKLQTQYGVQSIPTCLFQAPDKTSVFTGKDAPYDKSAWTIKPELIRYIPPKPIVVQKPIPQADSGGGVIVSPKFN
jgi:hypothetical protein